MFKTVTTVSMLLFFLLLHGVSAVSAEQKILKNIAFATPSDAEERITFTFNELLFPKIFAMKGERPRVVFDFKETKPSRLLKNTINTNGKFIQRIRIGIHNEPTPKTRVVFDLVPGQDVDFKHSFDKDNNSLIISVYQADNEPPSQPAHQETVQEKETQPVAASQPEPSKTPEPAAPETAEPPSAAQQPVAEPAESATIATPADAKATEVETPSESAQTETPLQAETPAAVQLPAVVDKEEPATAPVLQQKAEAEQPALPPAGQQHKEAPAPKTETVTDTPAPQTSSAPTPQVQNKAEISSQPVRKADIPVLNSVTFDNSSNRGEMVMFRMNKFHPPVVFGVDEGQPRVVCDFKETVAAEDLPVVIAAHGKYVSSIRIGKETNPQKVRVVLDLAGAKKYDLQQVFFKEDNLFVLIINTLGSTPSTDDLKPFPREQTD